VQTSGNSEPPENRGSSSEQIFRIIFVIGTIIGVIAIGLLGIYAYLTYFVTDETNGGSADPEFTEQPITLTSPSLVEPTQPSTPQSAQTQATATIDLAATATAACASFEMIFPGTPCPATPILDVAGTATAACLQFEGQFPGTPCP